MNLYGEGRVEDSLELAIDLLQRERIPILARTTLMFYMSHQNDNEESLKCLNRGMKLCADMEKIAPGDKQISTLREAIETQRICIRAQMAGESARQLEAPAPAAEDDLIRLGLGIQITDSGEARELADNTRQADMVDRMLLHR